MNRKNIIITSILIVSIASIGFVLIQNKKSQPTETSQTESETNTKKVDIITFGSWQPTETRTILGTVESPSDIEIVAENSGTIEKTLVNAGQMVQKGQLLATYKTSNDISQIQYTNALNSLQNTKLSGESNIQNAEITLQNAKQDYEQALLSAKQNNNQAFTTLIVNRESAQTTVETIRDYVDRAFGVSQRFTSQQDTNFVSVGRNNSILKQDTKNLLRDLVNNYQAYQQRNWNNDYEYYRLSENEKSVYKAEQVQGFLTDSKNIMEKLIELIRQTNINADFTQTERNTLQAQAENLLTTLNAAIVSLKTNIEAVKTTKTGQESSITSAKNRVDIAETQLKLAQSNVNSQVSSAESQLRLAQKSQQDLEIRAPFTGRITDKFINNFDRVNTGERVFSIVSEGSLPEIVTNVTPQEWELLSNRKKPLTVKINGGDTISVDNMTMNGKLSSASQKFSVKLLPTEEDIENKKIFIGSFAEIQLPLGNEKNNLIPISAVSFEPSGSEVLVLDKPENNVYQVIRRQIKTGEIIGNAIEIIDGLSNDTPIIEYRQQVQSGETVQINE